MAEYRHYVCDCGYGVSCNPAGFDFMRTGAWVTMRCAKCNEIVHINASDLCHFDHVCPNCGDMESLSVWNPVDCTCPKCGKKMSAVEGEYYLADYIYGIRLYHTLDFPSTRIKAEKFLSLFS